MVGGRLANLAVIACETNVFECLGVTVAQTHTSRVVPHDLAIIVLASNH